MMRQRLAVVLLVSVASWACAGEDNEVIFGGASDPGLASVTSSSTTVPSTVASTTTTPTTTLVTAATTTIPVESTVPIVATTDPVPADSYRAESPNRILVNGQSGREMRVVGPGGLNNVLHLAVDGFVAQPTWAPDGTRVAFTKATLAESWIMVGRPDEDSVDVFPTPFPIFYIQWSPDSQRAALLGPTGPSETSLAVLDIESGQVRRLDSGTSYYIHWAPGSDRILAHVNGSDLRVVDVDSGDVSPVASTSALLSTFQAPYWLPDGESVLYVRQGIDAPIDELVVHRLVSDQVDVIGTGSGFFSFTASPDGKQVAYSTQNLGQQTSMTVVGLDGESPRTVEAPNSVAWHWSPDSEKILLISLGDEEKLKLGVYEGGVVTGFGTITPTRTFAINYLPFWNQYDRSHTVWSPDSSGFFYTASDDGIDHVYLQDLDIEEPLLIGLGAMAISAPR